MSAMLQSSPSSGTADVPVLSVKDLCVSYRRQNQETLAVDALSFEVAAGKTLAIVGESGSGKTATCRAVIGLLPPWASVSGDIRIAGRSMAGTQGSAWHGIRGRVIAMVLQDPGRSLNPTRRVGEQIADAVALHLGLRGRAARNEAELLMDLLKIESARSRYSSYPHELSGGMRQRIAIGIAVAGRPRLLLADESIRSLDPMARSTTLALLKDIQRERGMSVVLVSHNLHSLHQFADEVMVMLAGRAVELATAKSLLANPQMPYTRALLGATPTAYTTLQSLLSSGRGERNVVSHGLDGCRFLSHCETFSGQCQASRPGLTKTATGHQVACWHVGEAPAHA
jgi:oligopeptide/dipeptide ABC transporter ATP-binding protein